MKQHQFSVTSGTITPTDFGQARVEYERPDGSQEVSRVDSIVLNGAAVEIQSGMLELSGSELCLEETSAHTEVTVTF